MTVPRNNQPRSTTPNVGDGWDVWAHHVLIELERLETENGQKSDDIQNLKIAIAELKIKAGVWGLLAGLLGALIPIVSAIGLYLIKGKEGG